MKLQNRTHQILPGVGCAVGPDGLRQGWLGHCSAARQYVWVANIQSLVFTFFCVLDLPFGGSRVVEKSDNAEVGFQAFLGHGR